MLHKSRLIFLCYLCFVFCVFLLLSLVGVRRRDDVIQSVHDREVPLFEHQSVQQTFHSTQDGLAVVNIFLKNPQLRNTSTILFTLQDGQGNTVRQLPINGRNVPDGETVRFQFAPIPSSANHTYTFVLTAPDTPENSNIGVGSSPHGDLTFTTQYRPQHPQALFVATWSQLLTRLLSVRLLLVAISLFAITIFLFRSRYEIQV